MSAGAMLPVGTPNGSTASVRSSRKKLRNTTMTIRSTRNGVAYRTAERGALAPCVWRFVFCASVLVTGASGFVFCVSVLVLGVSGGAVGGAAVSFGGSGGAGGSLGGVRGAVASCSFGGSGGAVAVGGAGGGVVWSMMYFSPRTTPNGHETRNTGGRKPPAPTLLPPIPDPRRPP